MIPQILVIVLMTLGAGIVLAKDGQEKKGKYSFVAALVSDAIMIGLMYWGGFFDVFSK